MKKGIVILVLILLTNCLVGTPVIASEDYFYLDGDIAMTDNSTVTSVSVWNNYLFASTSTGLKIYDLNTKEQVALWKFTNIDIPAVGNSFTPVSTTVSDDYIVVLSSTNFMAVFPNEGSFSNDIPPLVRRLGLFGNQPRMFIQDTFLYVIDMTAATTIKSSLSGAYTYPAKSVVVWKVDLSNIESFPFSGNGNYKYTLLNVPRMYTEGYAELSCVGTTDNYWGQYSIKDGRVYFVTFNDVGTAPYKTLTLHSVSLDDISDIQSINVYQDSPEGLSITFFTETGDINELKNLYVYESGNEGDRVLVSAFGRNVQVTSIAYNDGRYSTTFYFTTLSDFETKFGVKVDNIKNGSTNFVIGYNNEEYSLQYSENSKSFSSGAIVTSGDYAYLMTGNGTATQTLGRGNDYIYVVDISDSGGMYLVDYAAMPQMPNSGNWFISATQSAIVSGNTLVCFIKQCNYHAGAMNISMAPEITYNISDSISIPGSINTNDLSQAILHGGKIYYPGSKTVGIVDTNSYAESFNVKEQVSSFPVKAGGEATEAKGAGIVNISVGDVYYEACAESGAYGALISSLPNGDYTVTANINGFTVDKNITVNVPDAVEITDITAESEIAFTAVNNTDKYLGKTESIKFVAVSYDESGNFIDKTETTKACEYGEETAVTAAMPETEEGGYIMIYPRSGSVLLDVPTKTDGGKSGRNIRFADTKEITATSSVNAADKVVTVTGQYIPGADLFAETVKDEIETVDIKHIRVSEDGTFEYTYSYSDDVIAGTSAYALTLTDAQASKTVDIECSDEANFETAMEALKENVNSGAELVTYFDDNHEVAAALGIDIEDTKYKTLSSSNKAAVMTEVYNKIVNNEYTGLKILFKEKTAEAKTKQDKESALSEVKDATVSTLTGILEKYKDVYGISDTLWEEYTELSNKETIKANKYFIKKTVNKLSDVPYFLEKAIESLDDEDEQTTGGGGGSSNSGGNYQSGNAETVLTPVVTPNTKMFDDVADDHWAKSCIEELAKEGVINGIGSRLYAPDDYVTREQMVKVLVEAFGTSKEGAVANFADVDKNAWYYSYIASAAEIGLTEGDGVNFGTGNYVTRQDAAVMLYRMAGILGEEITGDKTTFTDDAEIADYAKDAVYKMQGAGVINGTGANEFSPNEPCTRAMAAKIVYELKKACGR